MSGARGVAVTGLGIALPDTVVTNKDLEQRLDTTDAWITERSGIRERRMGGTTGQLAAAAGRAALADAGLAPEDVQLLVLCTETPDALMPATSATVAAELGVTCGIMDLNAACAGFVYGLITASALIQSAASGLERVLLIGADTMASITDQADRTTAVLFADGAGAVVLQATSDTDAGPLGWDAGSDPGARGILACEHGGKIVMNGKAVYMKAVKVVVESCKAAIEKAKVAVEDIDLFAPHQANIRIVEAAAGRIGLPESTWAVVIETTGNTSAASIPLALDAARKDGRLHDGTLVLASGFGAGMTWASTVWRWATTPTP